MDSTGSALRYRSSSLRCLLLVLAGFAVACAPSAARAGDDGWHLECGIAFRPLLALSRDFDALGPRGAVEGDIHVVRNRGGLGFRFEGSNIGLHDRQAGILGIPFSILPFGSTEPVPLPVDLDQTVTCAAGGPSWCFPLHRGRVEAYVLLGAVQTVTTVHEPGSDSEYSIGPSRPYGLPKGGEADQAPLVIVGGSWNGGRARLWRFGLGFEVGAELQTTGREAVLDDPSVQLDGARYVLRTRTVPMNCALLRLGVNWLGYSEKP